jgi:hypothetical protein
LRRQAVDQHLECLHRLIAVGHGEIVGPPVQRGGVLDQQAVELVLRVALQPGDRVRRATAPIFSEA